MMMNKTKFEINPWPRASVQSQIWKARFLKQRDIPAGEEILISYLNECELERSRHSRYKMLGENYLFNCDCMKCAKQIHDPDVTSDEEMTSDESDDDE